MGELMEQFRALPYPTIDCTGRTIIITGANTGLGKEAARHFVRLNAAKVILACRSLARGETAKADIEATTKKTGVAEVWELDLASYASVKAFAGRAATLPRIDVLVANASIATQNYSVLEGNESSITVNVISTYLLILLLLPALKASATKWTIQPTITIVTSGAHAWVKFDEWKTPDIFETINNQKTAVMADRYPLSKLLQLLAFRHIAAQLIAANTPIIINAISPGMVYTELGRDVKGLVKLGFTILAALVARKTEEGSRTLVHGATAGPESQGLYFTSCDLKNQHLSPFVLSEDGQKAQDKFWNQLAVKLETIQPGVTRNL